MRCDKCGGFLEIIDKTELSNACYCDEPVKTFTQSDIDAALKKQREAIKDMLIKYNNNQPAYKDRDIIDDFIPMLNLLPATIEGDK